MLLYESEHPDEIRNTLISIEQGHTQNRILLEQQLNTSAIRRLNKYQTEEILQIPNKHLRLPNILYIISNAPIHLIEEATMQLLNSNSDQTKDKYTEQLDREIQRYLTAEEILNAIKTKDIEINTPEYNDDIDEYTDSIILHTARIEEEIHKNLNTMNQETTNTPTKANEILKHLLNINKEHTTLNQRGRPKKLKEETFKINMAPMNNTTQAIRNTIKILTQSQSVIAEQALENLKNNTQKKKTNTDNSNKQKAANTEEKATKLKNKNNEPKNRNKTPEDQTKIDSFVIKNKTKQS